MTNLTFIKIVQINNDFFAVPEHELYEQIARATSYDLPENDLTDWVKVTEWIELNGRIIMRA